eukprot:s743_g5.t1
MLPVLQNPRFVRFLGTCCLLLAMGTMGMVAFVMPDHLPSPDVVALWVLPPCCLLISVFYAFYLGAHPLDPLLEPPRPRQMQAQHSWMVWAPTVYGKLEATSDRLNFRCYNTSGLNQIRHFDYALEVEAQSLAVSTQTCICCLEDFEESCEVAVLPCGHVFHQECIASWAISSSRNRGSCPTCRENFAAGGTE